MSTVALLYRMKRNGRNSIEGVFSPLDSLPFINRMELPCDLKSIKSVFKLCWFAFRVKEKYVHITGDVHYMAIFLFWKKIILTVHDCNHYEDLSGIRKVVMGFIWYTLPLRIADKVTVISPFAKEQLCGYFSFNQNKIVVVPNSFHPISKTSNCNNQDVYTILTVGSHWIKNRKRLIEAVKGIPNVKLNIIGKLSDDLICQLRLNEISYKNSFFISRDELECCYNEANVLFFASIKEGFGLPILEAQSCGLPVITSNTTSMPYVAGTGACLIDPVDVTAITDAILKIRVNEDYRNEIITNGFNNIKRFSKNFFLRTFKNLYCTVFSIEIE